MTTSQDDDDLNLFRQEMEGIDHLKHDKVMPTRRELTPEQRRQRIESEQASGPDLSTPTSTIGREEILRFRRSGIQERQLNKLQSGQIKMEAELDLHGMTITVAYAALKQFIQDCQHYHVRGARIIHGKGWSSKHHQPILKTKVNQWLQEMEPVLAFCSARIEDGGTGAVYILLRRPDK